ncbi:MAG TPA: 4-alpha-glucanotransferase [bacterium]|nr:4-alpha-glucanotransferase [bacterium]
MNRNRCFGVLLHPTALPGPHGIGSIGAPAREFVSVLNHMGASLWQMLPLQPPDSGNSPYSADSVFAWNPLLIALDELEERGLLNRGEMPPGEVAGDSVDYDRVRGIKNRCFERAFGRFEAYGDIDSDPYRSFIERNSYWIEDYALFKVIQRSAGPAWQHWPSEYKTRETNALDEVRKSRGRELHLVYFQQFEFHRQWQILRESARNAGVRLIGDLPIFAALNAADVWSHPEYFQLDGELRPVSVAGVPPDYFSDTGQLWGNPLYDWDRLKADGYEWWIQRMASALAAVDIVRIDHFRGFEKYWAVPAGEATAMNGEWRTGPGHALFQAIRDRLGRLPVIAEDLGVITPEVETLRDAFELPGMKILQFAFGGGSDNPYLPHHHISRCVVYTGTHDNNTTVGWWDAMDDTTREVVRRQMEAIQGHPVTDPVDDLLRMCIGSVADWAVAPVQDLLNLGAEARMNTPGTALGNWQWRLIDWVALNSACDGIRRRLDLFNRLSFPSY